MSELAVHGLNYTNPGAEEFVDKSPTIRRLIKKYVESKGGEDERFTVDQIMDVMSVAIGQPSLYVFLAEKDGFGVGLMTAHAISHNDMKQGAMIHIGVVDEHLTPEESREVIKAAMDRLFAWGEKNNMTSVFAQTMRSEKPFDRLLLKHGWKRITTVYEKEITNGKREEAITNTSGPVTTRVPGTVV